MKRLIRFVTSFIVFGYLLIGFLVSCTTTEPTQVERVETTHSATNGLFDAWNDASIENAAVATLVKQADLMLQYKQWGDAQGKLERTLRVSINYAPAWSRLSWLSLRAAKHNKAIQLAHRSNSYTSSRALQRLNWTFIRDANKLMGKSNEVDAANNMIQKIEEHGLTPQEVTE